MSQEYEAVYLPTDDPRVYESTPIANAGWHDEGQHGGAIASLVVGHVEKLPTLAPMEVARVTVELLRVVPLAPLRIETEVVREGKRIQIVEARVIDPGGTVVTVGWVQRLRATHLDLPDSARPGSTTLAPPEECPAVVDDPWGAGRRDKPLFYQEAVELREIYGKFAEPGPAAIWVRLKVPLVAGEEPTPAQRAVAAADFGNGLSPQLDVAHWVFMNTDLTVHLARQPLSEWVALEARSRYTDTGRAISVGTLSDPTGWLGNSSQTLYVDRITRDGRPGDN
ncbi:MAG: thioesterase family protein [Acidimicrobiia bacterium]